MLKQPLAKLKQLGKVKITFGNIKITFGEVKTTLGNVETAFGKFAEASHLA